MSTIKTFTTSRKLSKFIIPEMNPSNLKDVIIPNATWLLPQCSAFISRVITPIRNPEGKFSFTLTINNLRERAKAKTLVHDDGSVCCSLGSISDLLTYSPRGGIIGSGKSGISDPSRWNASVPLILAALKEYKNVAYNDWDWSDPARIDLLDTDNYEYSKSFYTEYPFTTSELLSYQESARGYKSGTKMGTSRTIQGTTIITKTNNPDFNDLPRLTKLSLCQTWIFMPSNYNKFMITNLVDLDSPGVPLVGVEVVNNTSVETDTPRKVSNWD